MKKKLRTKLEKESKNHNKSRQDLNRIIITEHTIINPKSKRSNTFLEYVQDLKSPTKSKGDESSMKLKGNTSQRSHTQNSKTNQLPPIFSPIQKTDSTSFSEVSKMNYNPRFNQRPKKFNYENDTCLTVSSNDFRQSLPFKKSIDEKEEKASNHRLITESNKFNKEILCFSPNLSNIKSKFLNRNTKNTKILIKAKSISSKSSDKSFNDEDDKGKSHTQNKSFGLSQAGKNKAGVKPNQDSFLLVEKVLGLKDYNIYGVMDGHGTNGKYVSQFVSVEARKFFSNEENYNIPKETTITAEFIKEKLECKDYNLIKSFYKKMSQELPNAKFDVHFSGTTCVLLFVVDNKMICSNTGDSRAILIQGNNALLSSSPEGKKGNNSHSSMYLSIDHKPENPKEKERIENAGGVVDQYPENGIKSGPYRVWVKGESYPGIAISRTLGDEIAESVGVIYNPDIIAKDITDNDKYFAIASDGVWEFLDNSKVMEIINPFYHQDDPEGACNAIITESTQWWEKEDVVIDDITIIVGFLRNNHY